jgi:hypothetical protein
MKYVPKVSMVPIVLREFSDGRFGATGTLEQGVKLWA